MADIYGIPFSAGENRHMFTQHHFNVSTMNGIINDTFTHLKSYLQIESKIPTELFQQCKGIIFASLIKNKNGVGIVMTRNNITKQWNGPCAVSINYIAPAVEFPVEKINYLLLINDDKIISLLSKNYLQLGLDIPLAIGVNIAHFDEDNIDKRTGNQEIKGLMVYLLTKEATCVHMTLDGAVLIVDDECNQQYYQKPVRTIDILSGNTQLVCDAKYFELCQMLNDYIMGYSQHNDSIEIDTMNNINDKLRYQFHEKVPLFQYYNDDNKEFIAFLQLSQLSLFPFAGDIKNKKYKLTTYNSWHFGKKIFQQVKNFWKATDHHDDHHTDSNNRSKKKEIIRSWFFNENIPLYQYYANNNYHQQIWNNDHLSKLPKFPFLNDIKHYKDGIVLENNNTIDFDDHNNINIDHDVNINYNNNNNNIDINMRNNNNNQHDENHDHDHHPLQNSISNPIHNRNCNKHNDAMDMEQKFEFNEIIPLYQYYAFNRIIYYDYTLLSRLPIIPYLPNIKNNKRLSTPYNPLYNIHKYYCTIKETYCQNTQLKLNNYNSY